MKKWVYKIIELETPKSLTGHKKILKQEICTEIEANPFLGGKKKKMKLMTKIIQGKELESVFNNLGQEGWDLIGIFPLIGRTGYGSSETERVHFIFKKLLES